MYSGHSQQPEDRYHPAEEAKSRLELASPTVAPHSPNEGNQPLVVGRVVPVRITDVLEERFFLHPDPVDDTAGHSEGQDDERPPVSNEQAQPGVGEKHPGIARVPDDTVGPAAITG